MSNSDNSEFDIQNSVRALFSLDIIFSYATLLWWLQQAEQKAAFGENVFPVNTDLT